MFRTAGKWLSVALFAVGVAACDESPVSLPEPTSVAAATAEMRLTVGDATTLSNQVLDQDGQPIRGIQAGFSSSNPSVVSVDASGNVRAVSPGTATITTSYGSLTAATPVTVLRDERGFVRTLEVLSDSVLTDVRAGVQPVFLRAFNGFGQSVCPQALVQVADRTVAGVTQSNCRLNVEPLFPGRTTVTVSADGVSDSFTVVVSATGVVVFVSSRPAAAEVVAGNTVSYGVRLIDEAGNPIANRVVNFDVLAGRLASSSATTNANGVATVQYTLPTDLRTFGSGQALFYRASLPSGGSVSGSENIFVSAAPAVSMTLYRYSSHPFNFGSTFTEFTGTGISAPIFSTVYLGVGAVDQYGNQVQDVTFTITAPASNQCSDLRPGGVVSRVACISAFSVGTATFTARAGSVDRSVQVTFTP